MRLKALLLGMCLCVGAENAWGQWSLQVVDPNEYAGAYCDLQFDSNGKPHIAYYSSDTTFSETHYLNYAQYNGTHWNLQTIESTGKLFGGYGVSLALDSNDRPHIGYNHSDGLKYAQNSGGDWATAMIDRGNNFSMGRHPSLVIDNQGYCQILYNEVNVSNRYAIQDSSGWQIEAPLADGMFSAETTIDANDNIHMVGEIVDFPAGQLAYAVRTVDGWQIEPALTRGGTYPSIAIDSQGNPHIAHGERNAGILRYTYYDGSQWHTEFIASNVHTGGRVSLALDSMDRPRVSFIVNDSDMLGCGTVMHGRRIGTSWLVEDVLNEATAGSFGTSMVIDEQGLSHIAYHSIANDRGLMIATGIPEPCTLSLLILGSLTLAGRRRR